MIHATDQRIGISKQRGFRLRYFLETRTMASILLIPVLAILGCVSVRVAGQTVCISAGHPCTPEESKESFIAACEAEKMTGNLSLAHPVRLIGTFQDPTGAPINFDHVKPDFQTIVQIKSIETGAILFAVPLRSEGNFDFELVPEGNYRLILVWMKDRKFERLPLADQPKEIRCSDLKDCRITSTITFHSTDNPIEFCPPK